MSYKKAIDVLPNELLLRIQKYIDGEYVYIPKKENNKKKWGENTSSKEIIKTRNIKIYRDYQEGYTTKQLASKYFLALKTIQKIIRDSKKRYL